MDSGLASHGQDICCFYLKWQRTYLDGLIDLLFLFNMTMANAQDHAFKQRLFAMAGEYLIHRQRLSAMWPANFSLSGSDCLLWRASFLFTGSDCLLWPESLSFSGSDCLPMAGEYVIHRQRMFAMAGESLIHKQRLFAMAGESLTGREYLLWRASLSFTISHDLIDRAGYGVDTLRWSSAFVTILRTEWILKIWCRFVLDFGVARSFHEWPTNWILIAALLVLYKINTRQTNNLHLSFYKKKKYIYVRRVLSEDKRFILIILIF